MKVDADFLPFTLSPSRPLFPSPSRPLFPSPSKSMKKHYDISEYSKESRLYDVGKKKVTGKFKDESPDEVKESFVGIRSKCYTFKTKNNVVKKAKGVNKVVVKKNVSFDDYKNCVQNDQPKNVKINAIRTFINKLLIDTRQTRPIKQR